MRRRARKYILQDIPEIVRLWLFRILVPLGGHQGFIQRSGLSDDNIAAAVGLHQFSDDEDEKYSPAKAVAALRKKARAMELRAKKLTVPKQLAANTQRLAKLVGLSSVDCRVLEFVVLLHNERVLSEATELFGQMSVGMMQRVLAVTLGLSETEIAQALSFQGVLLKSGLIAVDRKAQYQLSSKLEPLSRAFAELMLTSKGDPVTLLREMVIPGSAPGLALSDYSHIQNELQILRPYLERAALESRPGVNVLIYGAPGTGKTELARVLAKDLELELFEVSSEDAEGNPVESERRLRAYRATQCFFAQRRALVVFDEIEDVFSSEDSMFGARVVKRKAWMNRTLEQNRVPALWISNSIDSLDPAVIRRFDQVIELPIPPLGQRKRIIRDQCGDVLDEKHIARLAKCETLAPAVIHRAAGVISSVRSTLAEGTSADAITSLVDSTLRAQGHRMSRRPPIGSQQDVYDPTFIHADADLLQVADGLARSRGGRLCLFGPPGTGKTAYVHWLAERLDLPLLVKRPSDLLSAWVGDNEKNIARAFEQAEQDGALLLIDEADTFLLDRRTAQRSWEVSLTNEFLTQMENFQGTFVASTNLIEGMDLAALRRFDLKARFDFLRPDQAWSLLKQYCIALGVPAPGAELHYRLDRIDNLTPGDFGSIARRHRFEPLGSADKWVTALEQEAILKLGGKNRIGF